MPMSTDDEVVIAVDGGAIVPVAKKNVWHSLPYCRRSEAFIGIAVAFAGHLVWLLVSPTSEQASVVTPPVPIMVEWIAAPQPRAEAPPSPQNVPELKKPVIRPKPKVHQQVVKPKPVLATTAARTPNTAASTPETPKAKLPLAQPAQASPATALHNATTKELPTSMPNLNADYLHNPAPDYPALSREQGEQGKVLVRAMINTDGTVAQLELRKTSGFERLDKAALETVRHWRFVPARRGDQAVPAWVVVPISFTLEG